MKRSLHVLAVALLAALLAVLLTACSGGGSGDETASTGAGEVAEPAPAGAPNGVAEDMDGSQDDEGAVHRGTDGTDPTGATPARRAPAQPAALIRTATVELRSDDVGADRAEVRRVLDRHAGTLSEQETYTDSDGEAESARLVLRVPVAAFDTVVTELETVAELSATTTTTEDVTSQLSDTTVRIAAQRASLERIRALLARATTIGEIVDIEAQLTQRQADLDSLLQREAHLSDQSSFSTITVHLFRDGEAEPREDERGGFLGGLSAGWGALQEFGSGVALVAGALLPWLPVIALLLAPLWWAARRRRTPPGGTAEPQPAE